MSPSTLTARGFYSLFLILAVASCSSRASALRHYQGSYEVQLLSEGQAVPTVLHRDETFAVGQNGQRYTLRVVNRSARRVEAVITVDGLDVLDGRPGNYGKRGYLIEPWGHVDIDGWRVSSSEVAAFRFASVPDSYAARTQSDRNVGVIGVAVFPERARVVVAYPTPTYRAAPESSLGRRRSGASPASRAPAKMEGAAGAGNSLSQDAQAAEERPGLGTEFGEALHAPVRHVRFVRAHSTRPAAVLGLRYNDRDGLIAMGVPLVQPVDDADLRRTARPFPMEPVRYAAPPSDWRAR
jgi:hypothetical protein